MLFEPRVKLEPIAHKYYHNDGREFASVSRVLGSIKPHFQKDYLSKLTAQKRGISQDEVLAEWDGKAKEATDHGTRIHEALERYEKTAVVLPEDEHLRPMILAVSSEYRDYYKIHSELTVYDEEYEVAGTSDHILETTKHKSSIIDLDDYKTNISKGIYYTNPYKKYLLGPFDHVMDTNYFIYSMQLSVYAFMVERLTGRKIGRLSIVFIPPHNPLAYRRIPVLYAKMEAIALLKYHKELKHIKKEEGVIDFTNQQPIFE